MNFSNFPLDIQLCKFSIGSSAYMSDQMIFKPVFTFPEKQHPTNDDVRFLLLCLVNILCQGNYSMMQQKCTILFDEPLYIERY